MKWLLVGLFVFVSMSSFASTGCTYLAVGEDGYRLHLPVYKSVKIVERVLSKKGFKRVFLDTQANYRVDFITDISTGAWNGLEHEVFGDNDASAYLTRLVDGKLIYSQSMTTVSGLVGPIGKKAKSRVLLAKILNGFPDCSQL